MHQSPFHVVFSVVVGYHMGQNLFPQNATVHTYVEGISPFSNQAKTRPAVAGGSAACSRCIRAKHEWSLRPTGEQFFLKRTTVVYAQTISYVPPYGDKR